MKPGSYQKKKSFEQRIVNDEAERRLLVNLYSGLRLEYKYFYFKILIKTHIAL